MSGDGHFAALREILALLTKHRQLTWVLTKREITDRYAGQAIGSVWAILHPLALMGVYIFLFAFVFKAKIGGAKNLPLDYVVYLLSGLIPWISFQDSMNKGAAAINANANLVKQVVFPIEVLPVKSALSSMITQLVSTAIFVIYVLFELGYLPATYALLPVLFVLQLLAMIGLAFLLSSLAVYLKDVKDIIQVGAFVGMYLVPIVYVVDWVPEKIRFLFYLNPFSYLAWVYQDACYHGELRHPEAWLVFPLLSFTSLYLGYRVFRKLKTHFGNVL